MFRGGLFNFALVGDNPQTSHRFVMELPQCHKVVMMGEDELHRHPVVVLNWNLYEKYMSVCRYTNVHHGLTLLHTEYYIFPLHAGVILS